MLGYVPYVTAFNKENDFLSHEAAKKIFSALVNSYPGKYDKCFKSNKVYFWLGMRRFGEGLSGQWVEGMNPENVLPNYNPTAIKSADQRCVYQKGGFMSHTQCSRSAACGICKIPSGKILYLKGLCEHDISNLYDIHYYVYGVIDKRPYFR